MKTVTNNYSVHNPKPKPVKTSYPTTQVDENGVPQIVFVELSDDEITSIPCESFSLRALLNAGVDPKNFKTDTSCFTKSSALAAADSISSIVDGLFDEQISTDPIENNPEN